MVRNISLVDNPIIILFIIGALLGALVVSGKLEEVGVDDLYAIIDECGYYALPSYQ